MSSGPSSSVQRAIAVLLTLGEDEVIAQGGLGVVQIARRLGREKSQVSRTLKLLGQAGFVDRDPDTLGYRLGWRIFTLAERAADQRLVAAATPVLRQLVAATGERVYLTVLEQGGVLTVLSQSPPRAVQAAGWVGQLTPLHVTSSGRALLFDHSDDEVRALLSEADFSGYGSGAPQDIDEFMDRLRTARKRGYALTEDEFATGLMAVGAPVRDRRGRVVAALNVSAPGFRIGRTLHRTGRQVAAAAEALTAEMAGQPAKNRKRAADL